MSEVFDTAAVVLRELVDTGQSTQRRLDELEAENERLTGEYDAMKSDFFYNLDIIKA